MSIRVKFFLIILLAIIATVIAYPREDQVFKFFGFKNTKLKIKEGLDLQGGARLVWEADMSKVAVKDRSQALTGLVNVLQRRVNPNGTSEAIVQSAGSNRVIVEEPGIKDTTDIINLVGKTANLEFYEVATNNQATGKQILIPTGISGKDVDRADPDFDTTKNQPIVKLKFKSGDATKHFGDLTTKIHQKGDYLVTYLDKDIVFGPATVEQAITDGNAQLEGNLTVARAKEIARLINAGALPVPINLVEQQTVGPTLGQESIQKSLVAGFIGLALVIIFMILYYRWLGLLAAGALVIYTAITISIYKLSGLTPYAIVLTLAGIAGFILSIGMAVDANILIFERMKEELRNGKTLVAAVEAGFDRAWTSIRDSNISTLITTAILYLYGISIIRGFAVTLAIGVLISMFTAIIISRNFLRIIIKTRVAGKILTRSLGGEVPKEEKT